MKPKLHSIFNIPDPLLEDEPDFDGEPFAAAKQGLTDEAARGHIRQSWLANQQLRHEAWEHVRDNQTREDEECTAAKEAVATLAAAGKRFKAGAFPIGRMVPAKTTLNPLDYARQKIAKGEWIELYYFTLIGCHEATQPTTSNASDTFGITSEDNTLQLRSVSTTKASCHAVRDINLSWDEISFAGKVLARVMQEESHYWSEDHIQSIVDFFPNMDFEQTHQNCSVDQALIHYQAEVRKEWFDTLGKPG
ncbi:hypothetical protein AX17_005468 [Amanita inopinata Kibby_2008]|nr:hypothetical protein AX17_005468 [Amanita inopinata Kibby_2008]